MSRVPKAAVATTVLLSGLDGYDVRSVTFAAPALNREWGIGKAELGILLSAGLVGMAFGSFLLAPLADIVGCRFLANASLLVMASGSAGCAFAGTIEALAAWRILTWFEIGACIAVITPVAAEFSNKRSRPFAMALMALRYSVGGLLGGLIDADRASGSGFMIGDGRISSAIAPMLAGYCFAADFSRSKVSIAFGLAAAALLFDHSRRGAR